MRTVLMCFMSALFLATAVAPVQAAVGDTIRLSGIQCKNATCSVGEGLQPGLTTVEVAGNLPDYAGRDVRFAVVRIGSGNPVIVDERKVGIFSDGQFTVSIPAYNYVDGRYAFVVLPMNGDTRLAAGVFTKSAHEAHTDTRQPRHNGTASITGKWLGIAGTFGALYIDADGSYRFNELPGRYTRSGKTIVFSGPLAVWGHGRATIGDRTIEFYWTTPEGAKQYFVFEKI